MPWKNRATPTRDSWGTSAALDLITAAAMSLTGCSGRHEPRSDGCHCTGCGPGVGFPPAGPPGTIHPPRPTPPEGRMDIAAATHQYEAWLAGHAPLYRPDLDYKHRQMRDPFPFFRGTYYRWVQRWAKAAGGLADAPAVLAVGDLHVENFGTWRDGDGRLCWGVNDFDEADRLPYTHDLVRLAASVRF